MSLSHFILEELWDHTGRNQTAILGKGWLVVTDSQGSSFTFTQSCFVLLPSRTRGLFLLAPSSVFGCLLYVGTPGQHPQALKPPPQSSTLSSCQCQSSSSEKCLPGMLLFTSWPLESPFHPAQPSTYTDIFLFSIQLYTSFTQQCGLSSACPAT